MPVERTANTTVVALLVTCTIPQLTHRERLWGQRRERSAAFFALVVTFERASGKPKGHVIAEAIKERLPGSVGQSHRKVRKGGLGNL